MKFWCLKGFILVAALLLQMLISGAAAYAACANSPVGLSTANAGTLRYLSTTTTLYYCDGTTWVTLKSPTLVGGVCAGYTAGTIMNSMGTISFCDGVNWYPMKGPSAGACGGSDVDGQFQWDGTLSEFKYCDKTAGLFYRLRPNVWSFTSTPAGNFVVPKHSTFTIKVWGGGGGGGGISCAAATAVAGTAGTASSVVYSSFAMTGGGGGAGTAVSNNAGTPAGGTGGTASISSPGTLATTITTGFAGSGNGGGSSPSGGTGGAGPGIPATGTYMNNGADGQDPGGGGSGTSAKTGACFRARSSGGGGGGYVSATDTNNANAPVGTVLTITVGTGGALGNGVTTDGGAGGNGLVEITWN